MIFEDYKYKLELHAHTRPCSSCSSVAPERLVEVYDDLGYGAVCVTNHMQPNFNFGCYHSKDELLENYLGAYHRAQKAAENRNINVILGLEIRTSDTGNDYLVYGIDEDFIVKAADYTGGKFEDFVKDMKNENNVILQAHPFRDGMQRMPMTLLDGIEIFNMHTHHNSRVGHAAAYARDNDIRLTICGSDFHDEPCFDFAALRTKYVPKDSFELAKLLKTGDYLFDLAGNITVPRCFTGKL